MSEIPIYNAAPVRNYVAIRNNPISFLTQLSRGKSPITSFKLLVFPYLLVNEPALIREALVEHPQTLIIEGGASAGLARLIGHGILTNHGEAWKKSRRSLQPLFQQKALERSIPILVNCIQESLDRWRHEFYTRPFLLNRELLALSFRIKGACLFRYAPGFDEAVQFADAIWTLQTAGATRYMSGLDYLPWLPLAIHRSVAEAKARLYAIGRSIQASNTRYAVDDILSLLFAGAESPANTVVWALKLLQENKTWLSHIKASGNAGPTVPLSEIEAFDTVSQVLGETMRLYPAGWAFERYASKTLSLGDYVIEKGSRLLFSPYLLHRNPAYWQKPLTFNPLRFTKSLAAEGVPKFAYLPFGAGPRSCLGSRLALLEMKLILKMLGAQCEWHFARTPETVPAQPWGSFKLRLRRPVSVSLRFTP